MTRTIKNPLSRVDGGFGRGGGESLAWVLSGFYLVTCKRVRPTVLFNQFLICEFLRVLLLLGKLVQLRIDR